MQSRAPRKGNSARAQGLLHGNTLAATAASARPRPPSGPGAAPPRGGGPASAWAAAAKASSSGSACTPPRIAPRARAPRWPSAHTWVARAGSAFDVWPQPELEAKLAVQGGGRADRAMCSGEWPTRPSATMRRPKRRSGAAYGVSAYAVRSWLSALSQIWRRARAHGSPAVPGLYMHPGAGQRAQPYAAPDKPRALAL